MVTETTLTELNYRVLEWMRNQQPQSDQQLADAMGCSSSCIQAIRCLPYELMVAAAAVEYALLQVELQGRGGVPARLLDESLALDHLLWVKRMAAGGNIILAALKFNCAADVVERIAKLSEPQLRQAVQHGQLQLRFNAAAQYHLHSLLCRPSPSYQRTCRMAEMLTHQVDDLAVH